ncbi:MAG: hypothetical protein ACI308_00440 [Muribaculaceae bacterium]
MALHIDYLLSAHDCVIVPGWGAFLAQRACALSVEDSDVIRCPRRAITFNSSVNSNDGLLVNSLIRREGLSYDAAVKEVNDYVTALYKQVQYEGSVSIGRLGMFKKVEEVIVFEPYYRADAFDSYFGLVDLKIKTLSQLLNDKMQQDAADVAEDEPSDNYVREDNVLWIYSKRVIQVAASVILLIGACVLLSTPLVFEDSVDYAGINTAVEIKQNEQPMPLNEDGVLAIRLPQCAMQELVERNQDIPEAKAENISVEQQSEPHEIEFEIPHNAQGNYYLIVASLDSQEQALKFISKHSGDLRILERDGRFRVYAAQSNSVKILNKAKRVLANQYPDAWVL